MKTAKKVLTVVARISNLFPMAASLVAAESFGAKAGKVAWWIATAGDFATPGMHIASLVVIVLSTARKPVAPVLVAKQLISKVRGR